jgi:cytochrome c-type biogenesis protein CcsB
LPVLAGGRVKPLLVVANESLKFMTGKTTLNDLDSPTVFCLLSLQSMGIKNEINIPIKVEHVEAKTLLGMQDAETSIEISKLLDLEPSIRASYMTLKLNNSYKKELNRILGRINVYREITAGMAWSFYEGKTSENKENWVTFSEFLTEEKVTNIGGEGKTPFLILIESAKTKYISEVGDRYLLELTYVKSHIFSYTLLVAILAIFATVLFKSLTIAKIFAAIILLMQIFGMTMRVLISGRAPITNMYETVMFSGFGALFLALIISFFKKDKTFLLGGFAYNSLCLLMMMFANNMLDPGISPLVPVLRDNFWLSTHVTTIILSYAALALSWILANIALIKKTFSKDVLPLKYYVDLIYTCMKFGIVLLSAGIILGGVWADYSWGRFWGWDPKETWSLIVLLIYMAILHGRYTNWIKPHQFINYSAFAFLSVMMAWFGVNYILASGLHSYGFSEGGAVFLGLFFITQIAILIICNLSSFKAKFSKAQE